MFKLNTVYVVKESQKMFCVTYQSEAEYDCVKTSVIYEDGDTDTFLSVMSQEVDISESVVEVKECNTTIEAIQFVLTSNGKQVLENV